MEAFSEAYARILKATGCTEQTELIQELGIFNISPDILLALLERFGLNPHWVRTGEGEQYLVPSQTSAKVVRKLACIELLCKRFDCGRGIWKQIDENRQLLQFLQEELPDFLEKAVWVESWIRDTDVFLNCLLTLLDAKQPRPSPFFPRPWTGRPNAPSGEDPAIIARSLAEHIKREVDIKSSQSQLSLEDH